MDWLYHLVPSDMKGRVLYPLNELRDNVPEVYSDKLTKYAGREAVLSYKIPLLNCLWNDVIFMSSVPPIKLKSAYGKAGGKVSNTWRFFKIYPRSLDKKRLAVYVVKPSKNNIARPGLEEIRAYKESDLAKYSRLGKDNIEYWKHEFRARRVPLLWGYVPHILYKGTIDISDAEIIEV